MIFALAYAFADYWFIYLCALSPLLFRITRSDTRGSAIAAVFLGLSLSLVILPGRPGNSAWGVMRDIALLCFAFTLLSLGINRLKRYFKYSLVLAIFLSLPLEIIHRSILDLQFPVLELKGDSGFIFRTVYLSGIVFCALLIIVFNSLILLLLEILFRLVRDYRYIKKDHGRSGFCGHRDYFPVADWHILPGPRGPPMFVLFV